MVRFWSVLFVIGLHAGVLRADEFLPTQPAVERIFKEIGIFEITGGILVSEGQTSELTLAPVRLEVYSDGIDVRIRLEGKEESFLEFQIYRNNGIYDESGENLLPGIQGFSDQGGVIRHLCLTADRLTMSKHPSRTSDIEVTYAKRYEQ